MEQLLPLALGVIMLGLGLSLEIADFRRVVVFPRPVLIGLVCQMLILPFVCWAIAAGCRLSPVHAVGLMLLAAAPGGATANLYSHLAKGDVALNVTLTALNGLLSLVTLPLVIRLSMSWFLAVDQQIPLQVAKILQVFALILVPVAIGMFVRSRNAALAATLERPVKVLSVLFLVAVIAGAVLAERESLGAAFRQVGLAALLFNLVSLGVGYTVPRLLAVPERQAISIAMEVGIHNGTLAMTIATTVLGISEMRVPAAIYSLIMFVTAAIFATVLARRTRDRTSDDRNFL